LQTHNVQVDDVRLAVYEWGNPGGQQVILAHATGFHGRCWDKIVQRLPNDWHIYAMDARGHGQSENTDPVTWGRRGEDLMGVLEHFDIRDAIGVGHSMGGHCMAHACARHPERFKRLVLIDPVIFERDRYENPVEFFSSLDDHPISRRKSHFESWQAFFDRLKDRHPYSLWQKEILEDYCRYGVVPAADGSGVELACPGRVEAAVYMGNFDTNLYPLLPEIKQPVQVLRAPGSDAQSPEMDFAASPTWAGLAEVFLNGEDCYEPELTHFMPMQDPDKIARYIRGRDS